MNLRRASSFSWPCFCLLVKSGKHISLQEAPVDAAAHWFGPAGSTPLYYVSQWEHHRKVSVTSIWHVQPEGSKTLSFCFSTFPDTAHYQRLMHNFARPPMECHTKCCREEMGGGGARHEYRQACVWLLWRNCSAVCRFIFKVSSISGLGWLVLNLFSADDKIS